MNFSKRLETAVLEKYKNFSQFAEDIGLSNSLVRAYIRGESEPKLSSCLMLANFLKISPAWLAYGIEEEKNQKIENNIIDLVNLINRRLDEWLNENKKKMDLDKKSILVKIIYKKIELNEMKSLSESELNDSIGDLIEFYSAA